MTKDEQLKKDIADIISYHAYYHHDNGNSKEGKKIEKAAKEIASTILLYAPELLNALLNAGVTPEQVNDDDSERVYPIREMESLLAQAHAIIEIKPRKIVYANARKAWCKQFKALGIPELEAEPEEKPKCENCGSTDVIGRYPLGGYHCGKDECLPF